MGFDPPPGAAGGVAGEDAPPALQRHEQRREQAPQAVEAADVEGRDAGQRDEVIALPQPVHVGLAEAHAAAQQLAVEARVAHLDHGPQRSLGVELAEHDPLAALAQLELAAADPPQRPQHDSPGQPAAGPLPAGRGRRVVAAQRGGRRSRRVGLPGAHAATAPRGWR